jgi:hypothetical protein
MAYELTGGMTTLLRLQQWYSRQCNGKWEHDQGITIESCDNPGWWVRIQLKGTALENIPFDRIAENVDADGFQQGLRWLDCKITDGVWDGAGDETKLERILNIFLEWAERLGSNQADELNARQT